MTIAIAWIVLTAMAAGASAAVPPYVDSDGESLSLSADGTPLLDLLASIGRAARISFSVRGDASQIRVSDSFRNVPVNRALGRILSGNSHLLVEQDTGHPDRRIDVILLGPSSRVNRTAIRAAGTSEGTGYPTEQPDESLLGTAVSSPSVDRRMAAAEALAYRADRSHHAPDYAGPLLVQMLSDPEETVRARALDILKDTSDELPFDALAQAAREDVSADRRMQALALLVERSENGESRAPLAIALSDSDQRVRRRARELMLDWHQDAH